MTAEQIKQMIANGLACEFLTLEGDGRHWYAVVVSASFEGLSKIRRHQAVYATLKYIKLRELNSVLNDRSGTPPVLNE